MSSYLLFLTIYLSILTNSYATPQTFSSFNQPNNPTYFGAMKSGRQIRIDEELGISDKSSTTVVTVDTYGARGDGKTDDSQAFQSAWKDACKNGSSVSFIVPENKKYLLKPITFSGPCKNHVKVLIQGTVLAPSKIEDWDNGHERSQWILFENIVGLDVEGGGTVIGNGEPWWRRSCKIDASQHCEVAPTAIWFNSCKNLVVKNLNIKNSPQIQVFIDSCFNVQASNLAITAPEESPNTDGIHVSNTQAITINNCVIGTGDDCISIVTGSKNVKATGITCGPGHGISIGSLGKENSDEHVSKVVVDGATIIGTTNGVRIKTWQGGSGSANSIIFRNIIMKNVEKPIVIDQNYCDSKSSCPHNKNSAVGISNVVYENIKGTSASDVAMTFDCSKSVPCQGISLQDIDLQGISGEDVISSCTYAQGSTLGKVVPSPCF